MQGVSSGVGPGWWGGWLAGAPSIRLSPRNMLGSGTSCCQPVLWVEPPLGCVRAGEPALVSLQRLAGGPRGSSPLQLEGDHRAYVRSWSAGQDGPVPQGPNCKRCHVNGALGTPAILVCSVFVAGALLEDL